MKANRWISLGLILFIGVAGVLWAEAQEEGKKDTQVTEQKTPQPEKASPRQRRTNAGAAQRRAIVRQKMNQEVAARQDETHRTSLKELEDIKKIAEEEGATRTVEAIQQLIEKKNTEFRKGIEQAERARRERAAQMQKRTKKDGAKKAVEKAKGIEDDGGDND
ncbi:MAG: hypothetical protein H8E62_06260 [Planctomycetes bacterium]|nr:hypothetical protein [Planctomycetota bacterium]